jgi:hypothetical protein
MRQIQRSGATSLRQIAEALNVCGITPAAGPGSNKHQRRRDCAQPHALTRSERAPYVVNLAYRWFCGLSIDDKVPDRSAFSEALR